MGKQTESSSSSTSGSGSEKEEEKKEYIKHNLHGCVKKGHPEFNVSKIVFTKSVHFLYDITNNGWDVLKKLEKSNKNLKKQKEKKSN